LLKNRILLLDLRAKAGWGFFARMIQFGCLMQAQLPGVVVLKRLHFKQRYTSHFQFIGVFLSSCFTGA
jgi:hypothetical protein